MAATRADAVRRTARSLRLDVATGEVVSALEWQGIPSIVLKGPSIHRLLYDHGAERSYLDSDLLVAPESLSAAGTVLRELGFAQRHYVEARSLEHAEVWVRGEDGVAVDLHWTLVGVGVGPAEQWRVLASSTERVVVGRAEVEVLAPAAIAFHVALHAGQHGPASPQPIADLERALDTLDGPTWHAASDLARRLQATELFAAGLRLLPAGEGLAAELGLPAQKSVETVLLTRSRVVLTLGLERLARTPGLRRRLALVGRELVPTPAFMRSWWPRAERGPLWLLAGYLWRLVWLLLHIGPALIAWRHAAREARGAGAA